MEIVLQSEGLPNVLFSGVEGEHNTIHPLLEGTRIINNFYILRGR